MPMLEVPGTFTMLVPEGWNASQDGRTYELTRPGEDGAVHVSVYDRDGSPLGEDEAGRLASRFIERAVVSDSVAVTVLKEDQSQHRAVARFTSDGDGSAYAWLVFLVLWRERFLICSCNAVPDSSLLDEAERMFATIFKPKKSLFRKK
ncbi:MULTISPECIES: hypothetical protein [unclassified Kribbella]|uniref:hypothetical protein n=1 Tax=unclassified Kribbella TaxID=2644121 RepID=UPI003408DAEE